MHIATSLYTYFFGKFVGQDEFGNSYYVRGKKGKEKRWVIYNGIDEASKVPASWHRWLHHTSDKLPSSEKRDSFDWQKTHKPNLTATSGAYHPQGKDRFAANSKTHYKSWEPN